MNQMARILDPFDIHRRLDEPAPTAGIRRTGGPSSTGPHALRRRPAVHDSVVFTSVLLVQRRLTGITRFPSICERHATYY